MKDSRISGSIFTGSDIGDNEAYKLMSSSRI